MMSTWCEPVPCISGSPPSVIYWRRIELLMLRQRALQLYLPDMVPIFLQHLQAHSSANPVAFSFMFCVEVSNLKGSGGNCLVLCSLSSIYEIHHAPEQGKNNFDGSYSSTIPGKTLTNAVMPGERDWWLLGAVDSRRLKAIILDTILPFIHNKQNSFLSVHLYITVTLYISVKNWTGRKPL